MQTHVRVRSGLKQSWMQKNVGRGRRASPLSFEFDKTLRAPNPPFAATLAGYDCMDAGDRAMSGIVADDAR
jgi:hypothetical protein